VFIEDGETRELPLLPRAHPRPGRINEHRLDAGVTNVHARDHDLGTSCLGGLDGLGMSTVAR
jgi:hypothetical protein